MGVLSRIWESNTSGWSVSRILSSGGGSGLHSSPKLRASSRFSAWAIISLGGALPRRSSSLPETQRRRAASRRPEATLSLLGLAPGGGCLAAHITAGAGGLLHRLFTLTESRDSRVENSHRLLSNLYSPLTATCFCGPIRQVAPPRVLPDAVLYGVRTFLDPSPDPSLSLRASALGRDRPASLRLFSSYLLL